MVREKRDYFSSNSKAFWVAQLLMETCQKFLSLQGNKPAVLQQFWCRQSHTNIARLHEESTSTTSKHKLQAIPVQIYLGACFPLGSRCTVRAIRIWALFELSSHVCTKGPCGILVSPWAQKLSVPGEDAFKPDSPIHFIPKPKASGSC